MGTQGIVLPQWAEAPLVRLQLSLLTPDPDGGVLGFVDLERIVGRPLDRALPPADALFRALAEAFTHGQIDVVFDRVVALHPRRADEVAAIRADWP